MVGSESGGNSEEEEHLWFTLTASRDFYTQVWGRCAGHLCMKLHTHHSGKGSLILFVAC